MKKSLFGILLSLALMLGMLPALGMSQTAYASDTAYVFTFSANGRTTMPYQAGQTLPHQIKCDQNGMGQLDQIIKYLYNKENGTCVQTAPTSSSSADVEGGLDQGMQYITIKQPFNGTVTVSGKYIGDGSEFDYSFSVTCAEYKEYPLCVGGTWVTSVKMSGDGWSYTPKTDTSAAVLKLNGYDNEGAVCEEGAGIYAEEDLIIETAGTNTVSNQTTSGSAIEVKGDLTFKGNGTLSAAGGNRSIAAYNVTVDSGTVNASGGTFGVYAHQSDESGDITINGGVVSVTSTTTGLQSHGDITINGGEVSAVSAKTGISAGRNIIINKGNVTANSTGSGECGITANNGVKISGGTVEATGDVGISAIGDLVMIEDGSVKAACTKYGILGRCGVTIEGGTVEATASDNESYGIYTNYEEVMLTGGNVTASGKERAISGELMNSIKGTGWTDAEGTAGKTTIAVETSGQFLPYKKVMFPELVEYPLWVSGVQVTSANAGNVLPGGSNDGKVSFDPETNTLKLNGANITADLDKPHKDFVIYYEGKEKDLIIDAAEASTVKASGLADSHGIYTRDGNLVFNGTLSVTGGVGGIACNGNKITVNGKLTAEGKEIGIFLDKGDITVNSGAELSAAGKNISGIGLNYLDDREGALIIKKGAKVVAVGGKAGAVDGIVKNAIAGTAWTDVKGTEGKTQIEVNTDGKKLDVKYKKVQFPAEEPVVTQYTITYDLSGGTLDGQTGTVTKKVDAGAVITLPAPVRDGYTFDYWEGSRYNAGDKYTVTGDHTFTAVWKTGAGGDGKKGSGTKTGDEQNIAGWITIMLASVSALAAIAVRRKDILHR